MRQNPHPSRTRFAICPDGLCAWAGFLVVVLALGAGL
ncbi:MAG: hypothetical protein JWP92_3709 [Caulobacter sp.]|nr:hypothetical protein [Caulobacter sp.]